MAAPAPQNGAHFSITVPPGARAVYNGEMRMSTQKEAALTPATLTSSQCAWD